MRSTPKICVAAMTGAFALSAATAQTSRAPAQTTAPAAAPTTAAPTSAPTTAAPAAAAAPNPTVGGAVMDAAKPIAVNASAAPNLTTLVTAAKAAGLVDTLAGPGPFTVFAPTNDAFGLLTPGTVDTLLKPENKATLAKLLTYHVVPGTITLADLQSKIAAGSGTATLTTVEGEPIKVQAINGGIQLTSVSGNTSYIQTADVRQSNGVVHVVNGVLIPTLAK